MTVGDRRVPVRGPRVRTAAGYDEAEYEVALVASQTFTATEPSCSTGRIGTRMFADISTRR